MQERRVGCRGPGRCSRKRAREQVVLDGLHPLAGQRAGVVDRLLADASEAGVLGVGQSVSRGLAGQDPARREELTGMTGRSLG